MVFHKKVCKATVFQFEWPEYIQKLVKTDDNLEGTITNSDLEMAGILLLWLVMEAVAPDLVHCHVALFCDNQPAISWTERMASKSSVIAGVLLRALGLRMRTARASPLTAIHIPGVHNKISDVPSRSFGYKAEWHFNNDKKFLKFFNSSFPLPNQDSWQLLTLHNAITTRVTSILQMKDSGLEEWRRLPKLGSSIGGTGRATANLWEWILGLTRQQPSSPQKSEFSVGLQQEQGGDILEGGDKSPWVQSVRRSRPLVRRRQWTQATTQR